MTLTHALGTLLMLAALKVIATMLTQRSTPTAWSSDHVSEATRRRHQG